MNKLADRGFDFTEDAVTGEPMLIIDSDLKRFKLTPDDVLRIYEWAGDLYESRLRTEQGIP